MQRLKLFLPLAVFVLLAGFLFVGLFLDKENLPSPLLDEPFPAFSLVTLKGPDKPVTEQALKGEIALVNVWATWCISCRAEHPWLLKIADQGIPVYGVNYKDNPEDARRWLKELGDPYRFSVMDEKGRLGLDLGVYGAPETYLIDARGVIRYKHVGVVDGRVWQDILKPRVEMLREEEAGQ
ncbi:DsbE family thiol:disulfide interchange protein [Kistimonas scapharcae]|uniref:DsbE family thiol:disulfide interchange protein n=1 Tax=Kistimonas scapharcae TaxID=1036133 RepID=A0ABP8V8H9_9GAMM